MVNFGLLMAEICWRVWGTPANFNGFRILAALLHGTSSSGHQRNFATLNRGRHLYSAGRPSRGALAHILVMVALCNRADHIYFHPVSSFFFSLALSQRSEIGCLPYFGTWCGLSANLECRSEMCYTRLAANTLRKNDAKNHHLGTIPHLCRAISSQMKHFSTIGKNLLCSDISSTCPHNMANFGPLAADIGLAHPS